MRGKFNTTCDIYFGPDSAFPGILVGSYPCRLVVEDAIFTVGTGAPIIERYMTIDEYAPKGAWTSASFGMDPSLSDQIAIPSGATPQFWVLYTDVIIWHALTPYYRSYLVRLPLPSLSLGGVVANSSAITQFISPIDGQGGALVGGSVIRIVATNLVASGGAKANASGLVYNTKHLYGSGGAKADGSVIEHILYDLVASGGAKADGNSLWLEIYPKLATGGAIANSAGSWAYIPGSGSGGPPIRSGLIDYTLAVIGSGPIWVVCEANHGNSTGDHVTVSGCTADVGANGGWIITVDSPNSFYLDGSTCTGIGAEASGVWTYP